MRVVMVEILAFMESKISAFCENRIFVQSLLLIQLLTYLEYLLTLPKIKNNSLFVFIGFVKVVSKSTFNV